jgi:hypothetical protein
MLRAMQFSAGLGLLALSGLAADGAPGMPASVLQFGALGLCAYMVWRLHAHQRELLEVIRRKDALLDRRGEELSALAKQNIAACYRLADLLEDRPCLRKDHRIEGR